MGSLGWTPDVAFAADPQTIMLAHRGFVQERDAHHGIIFRAAGGSWPKPPPDEDANYWEEPKGHRVARQLAAFVHDHNTRFRARKQGARMRPARALKSPS